MLDPSVTYFASTWRQALGWESLTWAIFMCVLIAQGVPVSTALVTLVAMVTFTLFIGWLKYFRIEHAIGAPRVL
jgi:hypothetical protein